MQSIQELEIQIGTMIHYMHLKISEKDWHGVCDAANDLRELEAKLSVIKEVQSLVDLKGSILK